MAWEFETDPEYQLKLDWAEEFVRTEVEPIDVLWRGLEFTPPDATLRRPSPTRSRRRCGPRGCGPPISGPSSAARATGSSSSRS